MLSRPARIALTCFLAIWLNAVVPGHARGRITIPTSADCATAPAPSASHCCPKTGALYDEDGAPHAPTPEEKERCAVCFFAKGLSDHSGGLVALAPLDLLHNVTLPAPQQAHSLLIIPTYLGRAPPVA